MSRVYLPELTLCATFFWKFGFDEVKYILWGDAAVGKGVRPWRGGGAIDYCPCYGQIAFYWLITFSCHHQQQNGEETFEKHSREKSDRILLTHNIFIPIVTTKFFQIHGPDIFWWKFFFKCEINFELPMAPHSVTSIVTPSIYPCSTLLASLVSNKQSISCIQEGATVLLWTGKGCAKARGSAWHDIKAAAYIEKVCLVKT